MTAANPTHRDPIYRQALLTAAVLNLVMFAAEGFVGMWIRSAALLADAVDFIEDAGIYGLAVLATTWSARSRAVAALVMGVSMTMVGLTAVWVVIERVMGGGAPLPLPMAGTAVAALMVNLYCAWRLVRFRSGDAGVRSIWLSTRNDALLNVLVILAAGAIALIGHGWPDVAAGVVIAAINLWAAAEILTKAASELRGHAA